MRKLNILNMILFVVFFGVGMGAVYISFISDELIGHYENRQALAEEEKSLAVLKSLITDYEFNLEQAKTDPNFAARLGPTVLGTDRPDSNTLYPQLTNEQLEAAKKALAEASSEKANEITVPAWLLRCNERNNRLILFFSGAFLVLISLIWFVWVKDRCEILRQAQDESEKSEKGVKS